MGDWGWGMNRFERLILCGVPIGLVAAETVVRALGNGPRPMAMLSPFATFWLFSVAAVAITAGTVRRRDIVPVALLAPAFEACRILLALALGRHLWPLESLSTLALGVWYASLFVSLWRIANETGAQRLREVDHMLLRLALPLGVCLSMFGLYLTEIHIQASYDNFLYAFDGLLGPPIAAMAAALCDGHPWLGAAAFAVYQSYWLALALFILHLLRWNDRRAGELMSRWILASLVGWGLFFMLPGVGPNVSFYAGKSGLPPPDSVPLQAVLMPLGTEQPRNAMPSLHTVWVLLLMMVSWRMSRIWFVGAAMFAGATLFATLGLREHYLIDLVVAVPLAVACYALGAVLDGDGPWQYKLPAVLGGAALVALLMLAVRYGIDTLRTMPGLAPILAVGAVILSFMLHVMSEKAKSRARAQRQSDGLVIRQAT